jgi:hypothetical protein
MLQVKNSKDFVKIYYIYKTITITITITISKEKRENIVFILCFLFELLAQRGYIVLVIFYRKFC